MSKLVTAVDGMVVGEYRRGERKREKRQRTESSGKYVEPRDEAKRRGDCASREAERRQ